MDLLDRMLIIRTMPYTLEEMGAILEIRAQAENIEVSLYIRSCEGPCEGDYKMIHVVKMLSGIYICTGKVVMGAVSVIYIVCVSMLRMHFDDSFYCDFVCKG